MGRRKGSKNKVAATPVAESTPVEVKSDKGAKKEATDTGAGHINPPGSDDAREAAYAKFHALNEPNEEAEGDETGLSSYNVDEMVSVVDEPEEEAARKDELITEPITPEAVEEAKKAETSSETEEADERAAESENKDGGEEKEKEQKTVPLDALHEEREKRKFLKKQNEELEAKVTDLDSKLHDVLQELKKKSESAESDEFASEESKEIRALKREIDELKQAQKVRTEREQEQEQAKTAEQHSQQIKLTAAELKNEGYPGFEFLTEQVAREIARRVADDPENGWLYSPEGWKKVYKESVFPPVKQLFAEEKKAEILESKRQAKEGANLVTSPGKVEKKVEDKKSDEWTYADYLKSRKEASFS